MDDHSKEINATGAVSKLDSLEHRLLELSQTGTMLNNELKILEHSELKKVKEVETTQSQIKSIKNNIRESEEEIKQLEELIHECKKSISRSQFDLKTSNADYEKKRSELVRIEQQQTDQKKEKSSLIDEFNKTRNELIQETEDKKKKQIKRRKSGFGGPGQKMEAISSFQKFNALHVLGDVHGWAPGLINWLTANNLFTISISNHELNSSLITQSGLFPNPVERSLSGLSERNTFIDGHPHRDKHVTSDLHDVKVKLNSENQSLTVFLGDLCDRGDHSELVFEIVRQANLSSNGTAFTILGNHEVMLLDDDFERWSKNEKTYMYQKGTKHAGTFSHFSESNAVGTVEESLYLNFRIYQGYLGALLLTQHLSFLNQIEIDEENEMNKLFERIFLDVGLSRRKLTKLVQEGKWTLYLTGEKFLQKLREMSNLQEIPIPGGFSAAYCKEKLMIHAEPNALQSMDAKTANQLHSSVGNLPYSVSYATMKNGRVTNTRFFWERGWWDSENTATELEEALAMLPPTTSILHGHKQMDGIKVKQLSESSNINVIGLDEGMTPYWHYNFGYFESSLDPSRCPQGYSEMIK